MNEHRAVTMAKRTKARTLAFGLAGLAVGAILGTWAGAAHDVVGSRAIIVVWLTAAGGASGAAVGFFLPRLDSAAKQIGLGGLVGAMVYAGVAAVTADDLTLWAGLGGFVAGCVAAAGIRAGSRPIRE